MRLLRLRCQSKTLLNNLLEKIHNMKTTIERAAGELIQRSHADTSGGAGGVEWLIKKTIGSGNWRLNHRWDVWYGTMCSAHTGRSHCFQTLHLSSTYSTMVLCCELLWCCLLISILFQVFYLTENIIFVFGFLYDFVFVSFALLDMLCLLWMM